MIPADPTPALPAPRDTPLRWWRAAAPTLWLRAPRWDGRPVTPPVLLALVAALLLLGIAFERLYYGPVEMTLDPRSLLDGWAWTAVAAACCVGLTHRRARTHGQDGADGPDGATLYALLVAQALLLQAVAGLAMLALARSGHRPAGDGVGVWLVWALPLLWLAGAQGALLWRSSTAAPVWRGIACAAVAAVLVLESMGGGVRHWQMAPRASDDTDAPVFQVTQALVEQQAPLIERQVQAMAAPRPGVPDVFVLSFAPYADEDVFLAETGLVAEVMAARYASGDRTLSLVNHARTASERPWATPLNLERAIRAIAARMDLEEDVLFVHLSSHGARDGQLSASFWPLDVDPVTPDALRGWLDAAGVRWRIVSVSACYSGSWIEPLASDDSLVLTAADADHTSYGCGRRSPMTYFGRAMYDEALRSGLSFEAAHAQAREVLERREREAGKSDGYSNPQLRLGAALRPVLDRVEAGSSAPGR